MPTMPHPAKQVGHHMSLLDWWGDASDARKSAKAGIPLLSEPLPTPTGRQSEIGRTADDGIARLRRAAQNATQHDETELARIREQIRQLQEKIDAALNEEEAILARRPGRLPVEARIPDAVVASRRAADNHKEAAPIRHRIEQLVATRDDLAIQAAKLDHDIEMCWRQARSSARAIGELARRREARYWRLLCRRHPEGPRLADLFDHPRIALAPWVDGPADERNL
jgi:hypothetical protein